MRLNFKKEKGKVAAGYVFVTILVAFVFLALLTFLFPVLSIDVSFTRLLQTYTSPGLTAFMEVVSVFGGPWAITACILFFTLLFYLLNYKREALFMFLTSVGTILGFGLKHLLGRPRPTSDLVELFHEAGYNSFPSVHVQHYTIFFGFLFICMFIVKKIPAVVRYPIKAISLFLIFVISFSRMYLGVHWLTDVIGGYLLGLIYLLILLHFYFKPREGVS